MKPQGLAISSLVSEVESQFQAIKNQYQRAEQIIRNIRNNPPVHILSESSGVSSLPPSTQVTYRAMAALQSSRELDAVAVESETLIAKAQRAYDKFITAARAESVASSKAVREIQSIVGDGLKRRRVRGDKPTHVTFNQRESSRDNVPQVNDNHGAEGSNSTDGDDERREQLRHLKLYRDENDRILKAREPFEQSATGAFVVSKSKPYKITSYTVNNRYEPVLIDYNDGSLSDQPPLVHSAVGYNRQQDCEIGAGGCLGHGQCSGGPGCIGRERISVPISQLRPLKAIVGDSFKRVYTGASSVDIRAHIMPGDEGNNSAHWGERMDTGDLRWVKSKAQSRGKQGRGGRSKRVESIALKDSIQTKKGWRQSEEFYRDLVPPNDVKFMAPISQEPWCSFERNIPVPREHNTVDLLNHTKRLRFSLQQGDMHRRWGNMVLGLPDDGTVLGHAFSPYSTL
jgi:hypothetical protein